MEEDRDKLQPVTQRRPTLEELTDLLFAWRAVRHVKSNAVVLAKKHAMVGMGAGQPSRVVSVEVALRKAGERAPLSVMASRRVLPVPGRHPDRGAGRGDGHHPARRLASATRWRSRSRTATTWRWSSPAAATSSTRPMPASTRVDKLIIAEALRATEAGAIAASRLMGRGDREGADAAAVKAMREAMDDAELSGTIVIGEGERDEAPMLYIGEQVGNPDTAISVDIAVDPLEGTNLVATGSANATAVLAAAEPGGLMHAPDTYLEKLIVGPIRRRPGLDHRPGPRRP